LRQAAAALLAVPVLFIVYLGVMFRRSVLARSGIVVGVAVVLGVGVIGAARPATTVATPPTPIEPLTQAAFTTTFSTNRALTDPMTIGFSAPMDARSVAASMQVDPPVEVTLSWDTTGTVLTITPQGHWSAATLQTVTIRPGALARSGQPLTRPVRAAFLTRDPMELSLAATDRVGKRVATTTSFVVAVAGSVDPTSLQSAIQLDPPAPGTVSAQASVGGQTRYVFTPSEPLLPGVDYEVTVSGVRDTDGSPLETVRISIRTVKAPRIVRFRPLADARLVERAAALSVRFTLPMDRRATARAFSASVGDKPLAGKIAWAEDDTVLVFTPDRLLPYGTVVTMEVSASARSAAGVALAMDREADFKTIKKPVATPQKTKTSSGTKSDGGGGGSGGSGGGGSGGGAAGGGSWAAVESYYLGLMNCTRTGGWVTSTGHCDSPGGRNVAALKLDSGISANVSRPYAKRLAVNNDCSHFIGGDPGDRLRRAGYTNYRWAENLGCRSGDARSAVLASHRFFQSEKSYNGGHYVNLMNAQYDRVGIGVWVSGGRVRLVVDFYHP
jgi:uncharacterized membrane protein YgcG